MAALVEWGHATLGKQSFIYPGAVQNNDSRRIAEYLHGEIIGNRTNPKYEFVVSGFPSTNRNILRELDSHFSSNCPNASQR